MNIITSTITMVKINELTEKVGQKTSFSISKNDSFLGLGPDPY